MWLNIPSKGGHYSLWVGACHSLPTHYLASIPVWPALQVQHSGFHENQSSGWFCESSTVNNTHENHLYTQTVTSVVTLSCISPYSTAKSICTHCMQVLWRQPHCVAFSYIKTLSNIQVSLYRSQLYTMQTNRHTEDCAIQTGFDWITAYIIRLPGKSTAEGMRQRQPVSYQWAG